MGIKQHKPAHWTDTFTRQLRTKLGLGIVSGALLIGGTAAAFAFWPTPTVTKTTLKPLPSGNHIIGYDTANCDYFAGAKGTQAATVNEKVYYEVRAGSTMTDAQLQSSLQGVCEENMSNEAVSVVEHSLPKDRQGNSSEAYTVTAISANSITVSLDSHYSDNTITKPNQTYTHFDSNLVVYNESTPSNFGALKVGDTIKMVTKDTTGRQASPSYEPTNHPENQMVEAIVKTPALTADPSDFYKGLAKDFVRVEPCTSNASGYCEVYNFVK